MSSPLLKIYTKSKGCVQCDTTKRMIASRGFEDRVEFLYVDLNEEHAEEARSLGYTQAPVLVAPDGESASGFDPDFISRKVA